MTTRTAANSRDINGVYIAAVALSLLLLLGGACGPSAGPGDPGNHRLSQLRADPVFALLPPGAQLSRPVQEIPAKWQDNGLFEPSGWNGPAVTMTLVDSDLPQTVFAFYAAQANGAGWVGNGNVRYGYPQAWTKTFPGEWMGGLSLIDISGTTAKPGEGHVFVLNASAPPVAASG